MERSEPALVPEWLRNTASGTGSGVSSVHHSTAPSSHSDVLSSLPSLRSRSIRNNSDRDTPRSPFVDRSSPSNSRRSNNSGSINGSAKHPYSSFTRSHRDKNRDREKDRSVIGDLLEHELQDTMGSILIARAEKNMLRRSQSLVSRKPGEVLPHSVDDLRNGVSNNHNQIGGNGAVLSAFGKCGGVHKAAFEKDFPSLGTEEKQGISRVSSPVLSTAVQSLPIGNTVLLGGKKWTSALAEVPAIPSNGLGNPSIQQSGVTSPSSGTSSAIAGLNMAEALSQAPPRTRVNAQLPDKTQRLEELAIKQSRQLIPMTPSMPKASVSSSGDKSKQTKSVVRTTEIIVTGKSTQQPYSSQLNNQSGGQVKSDAPSISHGGKFLVLKPARENGVTASVTKDTPSATSNASGRVSNGQLIMPASSPAALGTPINTKAVALENKVAALSLNSRSGDKRFALSQSKSRIDFFTHLRRKNSTNSSSALADLGAVSSPSLEKSGELKKEVDSAAVSPVTENGSQASNSDVHDTDGKGQIFSDVGDNLCINGAVYPDEEEAAFLRSLGWEENSGEDEGLTEEEINAFYQEVMKMRPSFKFCRGAQPKCLMLSEIRTSNSGAASDELSSSESESEA